MIRGVIYVNDAEKRRKKLLEQTRNLYQDNRMIPAVHPRYKASYYQIYPEERKLHKGTFGLRCMICVILFAAYMSFGINGYKISGIGNLNVHEIIMQNQLQKLY